MGKQHQDWTTRSTAMRGWFFQVLAGVFLAGIMSHQAAGQWAATKTVPQPTHKCDPPPDGGDVMKTIEIADQKDSSPGAKGAVGNWFVTRTTKWIPYCMYHDAIGLYSLDTYALQPKVLDEEIQICEAVPAPVGGSRPVAPFAGPCPPR
jgi:hypothetical protein